MLSSSDAATLAAYVEGVDKAAREAEAEWGMDRLPMLASDDLRARFNRQVAKWSDACSAAWSADVLTRAMLDDVARHAAAMQRAWGALSSAASEAGHRPIAPYVWEAKLSDGTVVAVVQTNAEASKVIADGRHVAVYTLAEVANVIEALGALHEAKTIFPGAKVQPPAKSYPWIKHGDEVPF